MKVSIKTGEASNSYAAKYPYLGISDFGTIVLFTSNNCGIMLDAEKGMGGPYEHWEERHFHKFVGEVTLSN